MKGRQVVLGHLFGLEAAALMQDGQLIDLLVASDPLTALAPGAICRASTDRFMKGQGGVFLRLPDGQTGYLRDRKGVSEGKPLLVQVAGVAEDGKAVPLSTRLLFRGRHALVTPGAPGVNVSRSIRDEDRRDELEAIGRASLGDRDHGLILRSVCLDAEDDDIRAELDDLIEQSDVLSLHAPATPETHRMLDARRIARMPRGWIVLKTARGTLIDQEALADTVRSGHLLGAGLDVLDPEPPGEGHPLVG
ncbi:MAG: NAD(P)-dependent oxidoreductase, partial [Paracoccus marcusii]